MTEPSEIHVFGDAITSVSKLSSADWDAMRTATIQLRNGETARNAILALARLSSEDLRSIKQLLDLDTETQKALREFVEQLAG